MKTKEILVVVFVSLMLFSTGVSAQYSYYSKTGTISGNGYNYHCAIDAAFVTVYNKNDEPRDLVEWSYKDGTVIGTEIRHKNYLASLVEEAPDVDKKCDLIVNNAFSEEEKKRISGETFLEVDLIIDTNTGNVIEVKFTFTDKSPFATIPIEVYRNIEIELKKNITYKLTETGKSLSYVARSWLHVIK